MAIFPKGNDHSNENFPQSDGFLILSDLAAPLFPPSTSLLSQSLCIRKYRGISEGKDHSRPVPYNSLGKGHAQAQVSPFNVFLF